MTAAGEVCRLAQNLAANTGYRVFPCGIDKRPLLKGWPERASSDPDAIAALWREHPGPLVGIVTGSRSDVSVLDIDPKHPEAFVWWQENHRRLLPTRCFASRTGGLHLPYRHRPGVTNTQGKICAGVDTRGEGGYIISWWCAGYACRDHTPPQPWPDWLFEELTRRPAPPPPPRTGPPARDEDRVIVGILRRLAGAREGSRNAVLFWSSCRLTERGMRQREIEALLVSIAIGTGLGEIEARRTIQSACERRAA